MDPNLATGLGLAIIGAGIAVGVASGLSAIGQGMAASAAIAGTTEKDYSFGKVLTLTAITETQAIYGFVIAILAIFLLGLGVFAH